MPRDKELTQDQLDWTFLPKAVVESRFDRKTLKATYSPEVAFYGQHYIIGTPGESHEKALELGNKKVAEIKAAMLKVGLSFVSGYPTAKE